MSSLTGGEMLRTVAQGCVTSTVPCVCARVMQTDLMLDLA
jgi:hypothetical protein